MGDNRLQCTDRLFLFWLLAYENEDFLLWDSSKLEDDQGKHHLIFKINPLFVDCFLVSIFLLYLFSVAAFLQQNSQQNTVGVNGGCSYVRDDEQVRVFVHLSLLHVLSQSLSFLLPKSSCKKSGCHQTIKHRTQDKL